MGQHWGPRTGHYSTLATTRLARRLRLSGLESDSLTARLVQVMRGQATPEGAVFTPGEAHRLSIEIGRAARRMWWTPGWRIIAQLIADDANTAWCEDRPWVIE